MSCPTNCAKLSQRLAKRKNDMDPSVTLSSPYGWRFNCDVTLREGCIPDADQDKRTNEEKDSGDAKVISEVP